MATSTIHLIVIGCILLPVCSGANVTSSGKKSEKNTDDKCCTHGNVQKRHYQYEVSNYDQDWELPQRHPTEETTVQGPYRLQYIWVPALEPTSYYVGDEGVQHGDNRPVHTVDKQTRPTPNQGREPYTLRRPTMPVYHYYPVPEGTFRLPSPDQNQDERFSEKKRLNEQQNNSPQQSAITLSDYDENMEDSYRFGYKVVDVEHGLEMGRKETREGDLTKGSYHVLLPDGRTQTVDYWSDTTGYHTSISYTIHH